MKSALSVCLLWVVLACGLSVAQQWSTKPMRLLEFNETNRQWVAEDKIVGMIKECVASGTERNFMDVTDHQDLSVGATLRINPPLPPAPVHQAIVGPLLAKLSQSDVEENIKHFTTAYTTRYYTTTSSVEAAQWLAKRYETYASHRTDVSVRLFKHSWAEPSVIARIEGSGPNADQVVILGGHIDSISNGNAAPGADDDASGSISVLEVFRVLAASDFKPSRSIEFHGYAAEEVGLRGSQDIASEYARNKVVVAGMMQLDMVGYYKKGTKPAISLTTDYTSGALNGFIRLLVAAYSALPAGSNTCGYGCSDHASWNKAGYMASHPFEAAMKDTSPYIHTASDVLANLDLNHAMEFVKVGLGFVVELGIPAL
eukprot:TRINITY_DN278_c0_g1_i1.p1 TRINITY_DN278_c0_g1~~TRINITY_DN278_c0_g1_i1.p1  ORF type:complete len:371 (-),score=88.82 TRINITY_DN278_c0_g1_i1:73-1185(-)